MAYLFDGGFFRSLYSVKETGRRLKNGAKEVIEDFLSGFNGHGWKLWKNKDSWKLEVDELLVRKSLTVYEQIISQVTSIKGSQAITQGHAIIKSVEIAEADVNNGTIIIEPFNSGKWLAAGVGYDYHVDMTENEVKISSIEPQEIVLGFPIDTNMKGFKALISGVSPNTYYAYLGSDGKEMRVDINEDGVYNIPESFSGTFEVLTGFFIPRLEKIFTITQLPTDVFEKKQCFRISIEDSINSLLEYDLIRCQKGDKFYHVQIGSVFQYYINIPVDEFDIDDDGNITNSPQVGDELVQFGNSSHDDKYKNRHSALYMHVDNDTEPAIDFMTDIYSKDWSNTIKIRIGGNLPGTDGDRGFYCVNGKLLFVDEKGDVVSVINPDGSASFAHGNLSWERDGTPFFRGDITSGDKNGKRIEINSSKSQINIFNEENKEVTTMDGTSYNDPHEIFNQNIPSFTKTGNYEIKKSTSVAFNSPLHVQNIFEEGGFEAIRPATFTFKMSKSIEISDTSAGTGWIRVKLGIKKRSTNLVSVISDDIYTESGIYININSSNVRLDAGDFYTPQMQISYSLTPISGKTMTIDSSVTIEKAYYTNNEYLCNFFAGGIALGNGEKNLCMIWDKKDTLNDPLFGGDGGLNAIIDNGRGGIKIEASNALVRSTYYAGSESPFGMIPVLIFVAEISSNGRIEKMSSLYNSSEVSAKKISNGYYEILFPDKINSFGPFYTILTGRNCFAMGEKYSSNSIRVKTYQGSTSVDGYFLIEVKAYPCSYYG